MRRQALWVTLAVALGACGGNETSARAPDAPDADVAAPACSAAGATDGCTGGSVCIAAEFADNGWDNDGGPPPAYACGVAGLVAVVHVTQIGATCAGAHHSECAAEGAIAPCCTLFRDACWCYDVDSYVFGP